MESTERTTNKLKDLLERQKGINLFHEIRFLEFGNDPSENRSSYLIKQSKSNFYISSVTYGY